MTSELLPLPENDPIVLAGKAANKVAARNAFKEYRTRVAPNTVSRQDADLQLFADYLRQLDLPVGDLANDPKAWRGITHGLVRTFLQWQLHEGYAIGTVNLRLSTIKTYAQLALTAEALSQSEYAMIKVIRGYRPKEQANVDKHRLESGFATRRTTKARLFRKDGQPRASHKKAEPIFLRKEQRDALIPAGKSQQDKRDALLVLLMLDQGLRVGEVAILQRADFDLSSGLLTFYRPKIEETHIHRLTERTLTAARAYLRLAPAEGCIWRASAMKQEGKAKRGKLTQQGISTTAIYKRVELLGRKLGIQGLSPHDLRHTFAERSKHNPVKIAQDAGGWKSPAMALQYQERGRIMNEGLVLED